MEKRTSRLTLSSGAAVTSHHEESNCRKLRLGASLALPLSSMSTSTCRANRHERSKAVKHDRGAESSLFNVAPSATQPKVRLRTSDVRRMLSLADGTGSSQGSPSGGGGRHDGCHFRYFGACSCPRPSLKKSGTCSELGATLHPRIASNLIGQSSNFLHSRVWVFVRKKELSCIAHRKGVSEASLLALETCKGKCRYRISAARCVSELPLYRR